MIPIKRITFVSIGFEIIVKFKEELGLFEEIWQNSDDSYFLLPEVMQWIHFYSTKLKIHLKC